MNYIKIFIFFIGLLFYFEPTSQAQDKSYQMALVNSISATNKSFVLSLGKKDKIYEGQVVHIKTESFSFQARAYQVSRIYSYWAPINPNLRPPLEQEQTVQILRSRFVPQDEAHFLNQELRIGKGNPDEQDLATLTRDIENDDLNALESGSDINELQNEYNATATANNSHPLFHSQFLLSLGLINGLSTSVDNIESTESRGSNRIDLKYLYHWRNSFKIGLGVFYEKEVLSGDDGYDSTRIGGLLSGRYYRQTEFFSTYPFAEIYLGYGQSETITELVDYAGAFQILPGINVGLMKEFWKKRLWEISLFYEQISSDEGESSERVSQLSNMGLRFGIGTTF